MIRKSWTHSSNGFFLYWRQEHNVCTMNTNIPPVFALLARLYAPAMTPKLWMLAWIVSPIRQTAHIHSAHEKNHAKWSVRLVVWLLWNGHNEKNEDRTHERPWITTRMISCDQFGTLHCRWERKQLLNIIICGLYVLGISAQSHCTYTEKPRALFCFFVLSLCSRRPSVDYAHRVWL